MKKITVILLIIITSLSACNEDSLDSNPSDSISGSENWATHRGNNSNTGYTDNDSPIELPTVKWKFTPGLGDGFYPLRPVVYNGEIYFGSMSGYLHALNMITGQVRWKLKIWEDDTNFSYALSTPTVSNETVFIGVQEEPLWGNEDKDMFLCAVDIKTRQKKWQFNTQGGG